MAVCGPYLGEDSVYGDLLLKEAASEVDLGRDVTTVDLDLTDVRLLLPQLNKPHLLKTNRVTNNRYGKSWRLHHVFRNKLYKNTFIVVICRL